MDIEDCITGSEATKSASADMDGGIFSKLVFWYRKNRRLLPWRGDEKWYIENEVEPITVCSYGIWVSEVCYCVSDCLS